MRIRNFAHFVLATAVILVVFCSDAFSRQWRTTPEALARDYATINDNRSGETFMVMWFVPQMVTANATAVLAMTQKYVVMTATHSKFDKATATTSFEDISVLEPRDQNGKALKPIARDELPPATAVLLAAFEAVLRQSSGALGKGTKIFIFEKGDVDPCSKGGLSVALGGEDYTWETPFPSCSSAAGRERSADRT